jgi:hypothetical protein
VTEGMGHVIDPAGVARSALQAAVAHYGPDVLWNADMLDGFCRDRLAGLPGEAVLISSAARSNVPGLLRRQVDTLGLNAAITRVAAVLSGAHSLNETACVWVVTEFARILGYPVPMRTQPMIVAAESLAVTQTMLPAGSGGAVGPHPASGPAGPAVPTGPAGPPVPPQPPGSTVPVATPSGGPRPGGIVVNRDALGVAAAIVLVTAYLGIAAAAHLSPFAKAASNSPVSPNGSSSGSTDPPPNGTASDPPPPDSVPDPAPDPDAALPNADPVGGPDGTCANPGTVTVIRCVGVPGLAAGALPPSLFRTG